VDAGLVPSIEAARIPGIRIVRGIGIASKERVRSVLLASKGPLAKVRSVALDAASRSSAAMAKILLRELVGVQPEYHVGASDLAEMLRHHDAALLIGDPALKADLSGLEVLDLAKGWRQLTGLPFVFAVWAVRPEVAPEPFLWSRDYGKRHRDEVVTFAERRTGLSAAVLGEYLDGNLHHDLDKDDEAGLAEFYRRAHAHGLIASPELPPYAAVPLVPMRG
jgi:chorismate dehydratase